MFKVRRLSKLDRELAWDSPRARKGRHYKMSMLICWICGSTQGQTCRRFDYLARMVDTIEIYTYLCHARLSLQHQLELLMLVPQKFRTSAVDLKIAFDKNWDVEGLTEKVLALVGEDRFRFRTVHFNWLERGHSLDFVTLVSRHCESMRINHVADPGVPLAIDLFSGQYQ